jgi:hypothetical protein
MRVARSGAAAIAANPEKSDRAIAQELLGVGVMTVNRARKSTVTPVTVDEPRIGLDGKVRGTTHLGSIPQLMSRARGLARDPGYFCFALF